MALSMDNLQKWKKELEEEKFDSEKWVSHMKEQFLLKSMEEKTGSFSLPPTPGNNYDGRCFKNIKDFEEQIKYTTDLNSKLSREIEVLNNFCLEGTPTNELILMLINKIFQHKNELEGEIENSRS